MATPWRVRKNRKRRPSAIATARITARISCQLTLTPAMRTCLLAPKNLVMVRGELGVGSQIQVDRARKPSMTLTGTTILVTSAVSRRPLITTA